MIGLNVFRASRRHVIGVDVVEFTVGAEPQARRHGDDSFSPERAEKFGICTGQITDESKAALHFVMNKRFRAKALRIRRGNSHCGGTGK
jgi:hypothetical protein